MKFSNRYQIFERIMEKGKSFKESIITKRFGDYLNDIFKLNIEEDDIDFIEDILDDCYNIPEEKFKAFDFKKIKRAISKYFSYGFEALEDPDFEEFFCEAINAYCKDDISLLFDQLRQAKNILKEEYGLTL